jgi:uncharacterized protein YdiU (UPF0061 family)
MTFFIAQFDPDFSAFAIDQLGRFAAANQSDIMAGHQ